MIIKCFLISEVKNYKTLLIFEETNIKKMRFLNSLKILLAIFIGSGSLHAEDTLFLAQHNFYLSISEIIYKKNIQTFEISVRFFSDDFEKSILNHNGTHIFDSSGAVLENSNKSIYEYIQAHFELYDERGKKINYVFIGWETEKEVSWCYLEAHHRKFDYLKVKNDFMTEIFRSQKNLVYLKYGKKETSVLLDKKKTLGFLKFE